MTAPFMFHPLAASADAFAQHQEYSDQLLRRVYASFNLPASLVCGSSSNFAGALDAWPRVDGKPDEPIEYVHHRGLITLDKATLIDDTFPPRIQ